MYRFQIAIDETEREALTKLAHAERRTMRQQIERLMREGLERRNLIESAEVKHETQNT
jgi:hypothetical protein